MNSLNHLFRAYDIRGHYGSEINPIMMYKLGLAVGKVAKNEFSSKELHVYVGYDVRKSSQLLAFSFLSGLASLGIQISFSNKPFPFGVVMYSGLESKATFTTFITASHLPPDWNGVKFYYGDGVGFSEAMIKKIRDMFNRVDPENADFVSWKEICSIKVKDYFKSYVSYLQTNFRLKNEFNVILDCGNGSACLSAPIVLKECNFSVIEQWCQVDATFPNRASEPTEESLKVLREKIRFGSLNRRIDFGVGFDGDGDRAVIIDDKGEVVPADILAILLSIHLNSKFKLEKPIILANIECSSAIEKTLQSNFTIKRIAVGHTFLTLEARQFRNNCLLGVESSGHFVFPSYFLFDDALLVPLLVGQMLQEQQEPLSVLVQKIPQFKTLRKTFKCADQSKFVVIDKLLGIIKNKYSDVSTIDGIAINLEDSSYVLIRASNTSPKIRLFIETGNQTRLETLEAEFSVLLDQQINRSRSQ